MIRPPTRAHEHDLGRRRRADDLRALQARPPGVRGARPRRARASAGRAAGAPAAPRTAAALPEVSEPEIVRHYNRLSKRNFDLDTGFYPLGSCTMKHNPKLHERVAALAGSRQAASAPAARACPGGARADVAPAGGAGGDRGPAARLAAAVGRIARRACGGAADARLPRGPRRAAHQGADPRHRARDQPGDGDHGRLRGRPHRHRRARQRRPRRPARQGDRRGRLPDAHQPLDAGPVRAGDRGDRHDRPRRGRDALLRRRQPERDHGHLPPGGHGLRHRPLQPAQVLHPAPRRRWPGRRADRRRRADRAVSAPAAGGAPRAGRQRRRRAVLRPRLRPAQVDRAPARLSGQLRRVRALLRLHPLARRGRPARRLRGGGPERQLPARPTAGARGDGVPARSPTSACACTSSCCPARR